MLARRRRKECSRFSTQLCNSTISTGMEYLFGPPSGKTQRERSMSSFADKGRDGFIRGGSPATGDPDAFSDPGHRNLILGVLRLLGVG